MTLPITVHATMLPEGAPQFGEAAVRSTPGVHRPVMTWLAPPRNDWTSPAR
ncbi:hypothetical protein GALL_537410 [mine drainage metagenome]|uniref:Uncharacterized protein n=1 Tax=mine drainage metagenome TaxID=410659 RepID=A0A1J5P0X2_9ZZZZ